ncbi:unnamed protein product [Nesidiocoris tenuis]|uniref:Thioredoxin n=2 Tax=Nesidiocoris tenuis TaxID=355587 RepID=A0ABN7AXF2_9HEMI|nr:Thioredoxin [Nesidiocoris tenuis]CAB0001319.1 unnamed protein product [Nesidiocoris tenuis]
MLVRKFCLLLTIVAVAFCQTESLESVNDEELLGLFRNEKYVIVLFTKKDCAECDKLENILTNIREDLVETCGAWVVKSTSSPLVKLYSPSKEPAIVFFRHGVPLLYDGEISDDAISHFLTDNKEPVVKELTDETFEHLTQASSGATTGDWFIMFYSNDCIDCQRLQARWETVGAKLKTRLNVARVNRKTTGRVTSRRFHIIEEPTFLFFRLGKMYHYNIPRYDVASFVSFASDWYKNARSEKVPVPKSPFDDLTQQIADYLRENAWVWKLVSIFTCIALTLTFLKRLRAAESTKSKKPEPSKVPSGPTEKVKKSK